MKTTTRLVAALLVALAGLILVRRGGEAGSNPSANLPAAAPHVTTALVAAPADTPALAGFEDWMGRFQAAAAQGHTAANLLAEGQQFARGRRELMLQLMRENPRRALAESVKWHEWVALPAEIRALVEEPFSETADLSVMSDCRPVDARQTPWQSPRVEMRGEHFDASVYGRREHGQSKRGVPLQGIRLGNQVALWEKPVQPLNDEDLRAAQQIFPDGNERTRSWVSGERLNDSGKAALVGGKIHYFASKEEIQEVADAIAEAEIQPGPHNVVEAMATTHDGGTFDTKVFLAAAKSAKSAWTETPKRVLAMIVNFTPNVVHNYPSNVLAAEFNVASNSIYQMSFGKTRVITTIPRQVITITNNQQYWETNTTGSGGMESAAKAVAAGLGYVLADYDIFVVVSPWMQRYAGAAAFAGGSGMFINGGPTGSGNVIHELGHNYGYAHANYWRGQTGAGLLGTGTGREHQEYGDVFDRMGNGNGDDVPNTDHFSMRAKSYFNWIEAGEVINVTKSGVYRVRRFDHVNARSLAGTKLALQVRNAVGDEFWIGYRRALTNAGHETLTNSAYVIWANHFNAHRLIDTTPLSVPGQEERRERLDAPLPVGRTWVDPSGTLSITTLGTGDAAPFEYLDVRVTLITNVPPLFSLFTTSNRTTNGLIGSYVDSNLGSRSAQEDWFSAGSGVSRSGTRIDPVIQFTSNSWGNRSTVGLTGGSDANWDNFSVQWDGWIQVHRLVKLATRSDDSSRMWIDFNGNGSFETNAPEFINNHWGRGQSATVGDVSVAVAPGLYRIRIQYEEGGGDNSCELLASPVEFELFTTSALATNGLIGSYVNANLRGSSAPADWRTSQVISGTRRDLYPIFPENDQWGARAQVGVTGGTDEDWDNFSVQWDGWIRIHTPTRFTTLSDDSSRLWIDADGNGTFGLFDPEYANNHWGIGQPNTYGDASGFIAPGAYRIRIQYEEGAGGNHFALYGASEPVTPFAPYPSTVTVLNPLAYWRLNENSGAIALDSVGRHHGTYLNTSLGHPGYGSASGNGTDPMTLAAQFGPAIGSYSYVSIPSLDLSVPSGGNGKFSVAAWVKANNPITWDAGIFSKGDGGGDEQFALDCGGPGNGFRFFVRNAAGAAYNAPSTISADNNWHHLVGVCDQANSKLLLYVDGVLVSQATIPPSTGIRATPIAAHIGARTSSSVSSPDLQFLGLIDEVSVFTNALSASEVASLYGRPPIITQQPSPQTLMVGGNLSLSVASSSYIPQSYFWRFQGTPIPNATNATFSLPNIQFGNGGNYTVVCSNFYGAVTSSPALVTVYLTGSAYPNAVAALNPLGYWRLNETTGPTAFDHFNGNNGSYINPLNLGQPGHGSASGTGNDLGSRAAQFGPTNGSQSHVTIPTVDVSAPSGGNGRFTVAAWVKAGTAVTAGAGIFAKGYGAGGEQFALDCGGPGNAFRFFVRSALFGSPAYHANSTVTPDDQWHLLVGVCDQANGSIRLYVDGTNAAFGPILPGAGIRASADPASIGARRSSVVSGYDHQFVGLIDDAAIFTEALTPAQVLALYAAANKPPTITQQPAANLRALTGTSVTNKVTATGTGLSFQWFGPNGAVPGATSSNLVLANITLPQQGNYFVVVSNISGAVQSSNFFLTVIVPNSGFAQALLALNPLAYWPLDETNGTTATDLAGSNHGTYTNVVLGQPGFNSGFAAQFGPTNGAQSYISIPTIDFHRPYPQTTTFTIAAWVLGSNTTASGAGIVSKGAGNGGEQFALDCGGPDKSFRLFVRDDDSYSGNSSTSTSPIPDGPDNQWHWVVATFEHNLTLGSLKREGIIYVDGFRASAFFGHGWTTFPLRATAEPASIGGRRSGTNAYDLQFVGLIDEVAIFTNVLSASQIRALYGEARPFPAIYEQPSATFTGPAGGSAINQIAVTGSGLAYQWYGPSGPVAGATNSELVLTNLQLLHEGDYFVVISNSYGVVQSSTASLNVRYGQPSPTFSGAVGGSATNQLDVPGSGLAYQWYGPAGPIVGATNTVLVVTNLQFSDHGNQYYAISSNSFGAVQSSYATLKIHFPPGAGYAGAVSALNPIAYWRLNETNGTTAIDYGNFNAGTYNNATLGQPGTILSHCFSGDLGTRAAQFGPNHGAQSYVSIPSISLDAPIGQSSRFSIAAWVNASTATSLGAGIVSKGDGGGDEQFSLDCGGTNKAFRFLIRTAARDGGNLYVTESSVVPDNQWHHLVAVCDTSVQTIRLYVDGTLVAATQHLYLQSLRPTSVPARIGARSSAAGQLPNLQFVGRIHDVAIFPVPLSAQQVAALYCSPVTAPPLSLRRHGGNVQLSWPDVAGFSLEAKTNLSQPGWTTVTNAPVLSNGLNTVTIPMGGAPAQFFQLRK